MIRYLLRFASLVSLPICFASIVDLANSETNSEIIYSVVSGSAHLPCNVSPPQGSNDEPRLILWYKDSDPQPVYSFDNRYTNPKHWSQVLLFLIIWYLKVAKSQSWEVSKIEKILKGSLDSIRSPSLSVKIQIMDGKVCLRCKGKTLLGVVNNSFVFKVLLTSPSNVFLYYLM